MSLMEDATCSSSDQLGYTKPDIDVRQVVLADYILDNVSIGKPFEPKLEVVFESDSNSKENMRLHSKELDEDSCQACHHGQARCKNLQNPFAVSGLCKIPIKCMKTLRQVNQKENRKGLLEITFDLENREELMDWRPGSTFGILPRNRTEEVDELLDLLELRDVADHTIRHCCHSASGTSKSKKPSQIPSHIPIRTTPRELLQDCLNIRFLLKKRFLQIMATYCTDDNEIKFLNGLSAVEGAHHYQELCIERRLTLADVLSLCPTCRPTLGVLSEFLPRLMPRPYSIINSPLEGSCECRVIVSLDAEKKSGSQEGVTSSMLRDEQLNHVFLYLREPTNHFQYSIEEFQRNQLLIAVGSAVAPYLSFLKHKKYLMDNDGAGLAGETWLILGATSAEAIPYRSQLLDYTCIRSRGRVLGKFVECHSRSTEALTPFHHVQDAFLGMDEELCEFLLRDETDVYVCADGATISRAIEESLAQCLMKYLSIDQTQVTDLIKTYRKRRKYREEIWL